MTRRLPGTVAMVLLAALVAGCDQADPVCASEVGAHDTESSGAEALTGAGGAAATSISDMPALVSVRPALATNVKEGDAIVLVWDGDPGPVVMVSGGMRCTLAGSGNTREVHLSGPEFLLEWGDDRSATVSFANYGRGDAD